MMSTVSMFFSACEGIIPIAVIVVLIVLLVRKSSFSFKPFGVGILIFIVFSQVLEAMVHFFVLKMNHTTSTFLANHPFAYATYGALAAGIFEEVGRYAGFRLMLRRFREWKDGVSYGLGHGGIEALLIGTVVAIEAIAFSNARNLPATLPADAKAAILSLVHQPTYVFALGTVERLAALPIHIALSLIVLYGIKRHRISYLGLAILLHAATDFVPALYQRHVASLVATEIVFLAVAIAATTFVTRSKRLFEARS